MPQSRIKQIKKRMGKVVKEISLLEKEYHSLRTEIVPDDPTNNSRLIKNQLVRIKSQIKTLKNEHKTLQEEAFKF